MFAFLETICINEGRAQHLDFHQMRMNDTFDAFFPEEEPYDIQAEIAEHALPLTGMHRLRMIYSDEEISIEILPYAAKNIQKLTLVDTGEIDYAHKWADRTFFKTIVDAYPHADEVLFVKDGKIQDCSIANLAFLKEGIWYTPEEPLHWGTTRARLIIDEALEETDIFVDELATYERICLLNVFRPLSMENSISLAESLV